MGSAGPKADGIPQPALRAFGVSLLVDQRPPGAWQARAPREPLVEIQPATAQTIEDNWSGMEGVAWEGVIDDAPFVVERGVDGDHRFVHGDQPKRGGLSAGTRAIHRLCADTSVLQCAPSDPADPSWWRIVLDSVLFTVALLCGYEALHAGAIATPDGAVAITAATGGGKSTLLAALLGRGSALMADDVLVLEPRDTAPPLVHPAPPVMTVPAAAMPVLCGADCPETISSVGEERWIAVPVHAEPLPLKALVVLDRRPGSQTSGPLASLTKIENPLAALMSAFMNFPRTPERQRARFELASTIASASALWRLSADLDTPPNVLADLLLRAQL
jgi:hypothetical protein